MTEFAENQPRRRRNYIPALHNKMQLGRDKKADPPHNQKNDSDIAPRKDASQGLEGFGISALGIALLAISNFVGNFSNWAIVPGWILFAMGLVVVTMAARHDNPHKVAFVLTMGLLILVPTSLDGIGSILGNVIQAPTLRHVGDFVSNATTLALIIVYLLILAFVGAKVRDEKIRRLEYQWKYEREVSRSAPSDLTPNSDVSAPATELSLHLIELKDVLEEGVHDLAFQYTGAAKESLTIAESLMTKELRSWKDADGQAVRGFIATAWPPTAGTIQMRCAHMTENIWQAREIIKRRLRADARRAIR